MDIVAVVIGFAVLGLLGAAVRVLAGVRPDGVPGLAGDVAAGAALLGAWGMLSVVAGWPLSPVPVYVAVAVTTLAAGRRLWARPRLALRGDGVARLLALVGVGVLAALVLASLEDRLWWDGWAVWAFKGRVLLEEGTLPRAFLDPAFFGFARLDYPLGLPILDWWIFRHAGAFSARALSLAGAVWVAVLAALVWTACRDAGERVAAAAALGVAAFWPLTFYATGGTADILVAVALLGAALHLERGIRSGRGAPIAEASAYLVLGAVAKNEGLAIAAIAAVVGGIALIPRRRLKHALVLLLPFVMLAPWILLRRELGLGAAVLGVPADAGAALERVPLVALALAQMLARPVWLPLAVLGAAGALAARAHPPARSGWALVTGYAGTVLLVYLIAPLDAEWLLGTSLERVLAPVAPTVVWLARHALSPRPAPDAAPAGAAVGEVARAGA